MRGSVLPVSCLVGVREPGWGEGKNRQCIPTIIPKQIIVPSNPAVWRTYLLHKV